MSVTTLVCFFNGLVVLLCSRYPFFACAHIMCFHEFYIAIPRGACFVSFVERRLRSHEPKFCELLDWASTRCPGRCVRMHFLFSGDFITLHIVLVFGDRSVSKRITHLHSICHQCHATFAGTSTIMNKPPVELSFPMLDRKSKPCQKSIHDFQDK